VCSRSTARDVVLAAEIVRDVLTGLSGAADVVVVDLPRPDHEFFAVLAASVDAIVLLARSGMRDLAGSSAIVEDPIGLSRRVALSAHQLHGHAFRGHVAGALDLPLLAVVREEPSLATDMHHGVPPGSSAKGALAAAADTELARCVC